MRFAALSLPLTLLLVTSSASAAPVITNDYFASGTTGWNTAGTITQGVSGYLPTSYILLNFQGGVSAAQAESDLGLTPGTLEASRVYSYVYQDIMGTYTAADTFNMGVGAASNNTPTFFSTVGYGLIDLTTNSLWLGELSNGGVATSEPPREGYTYSANSGMGTLQLGTSNPLRVFALLGGPAAPTAQEEGVLAFTFGFGPLAAAAPELDPGEGLIPWILVGLGFLIFQQRRQPALDRA